MSSTAVGRLVGRIRFAEDERKEVELMAERDDAPTNEHIVRLLESVRTELAESKKQQEQIARHVERLLKQSA
jgi:hypothetical protein